MPMRNQTLPLALVLGMWSAALIRAQLPAGEGDWPGWRGADRTGVSSETGLLTNWPSAGPPLAWKTRGLGKGYSTPAVAKGRIYLIGTTAPKHDTEYVICLDAKREGKKLWATALGKVARVGYAGPRGTPTIDGRLLVALGSDGDLACLDANNGKVNWKKNYKRDFAGRHGAWGFAESPLVDGDFVVGSPGGPDAGLVAFHKRTGKLVWKSMIPERDLAGYSSPIVAEVGGIKQYVSLLSKGVVGVDAKTGKFLWRYDRPSNTTANVPTAVFADDAVFCASGYGTGGGLVRLTKTGKRIEAEQVYETNQLVNHHGGFVLVDGCIFGANERSLLCLDFKTGQVLWQDRCVGKGSITAADGHLYVRSENGPVALVEASRAGYREKGRLAQQPDRSGEAAWPHPVVAGGLLLLRDQDVLLAYDVKGR